MRTYLSIVLAIFTLFSSCAQAIPNAQDSTVRIGSFNIQIFGQTKLSRPNVMTVLAKIATTYDVLAIEEVGSNASTSSDATCETIMSSYVAKINSIAGNNTYGYVRGNQYGIVYKRAGFEVVSSGLYTGSQAFTYTPLTAYLKSKTGNFDFILIVIHTRPELAGTEIPALKVAMGEISALYSEPDVFSLGDFNGDGNYYTEGSGDSLAGFPVDSYITAIPNSADTTVASSSNTYDRMELTKTMTSDYAGTYGIIYFAKDYDMTILEGAATTQGKPEAVSDHYPVYAEFYLNKDTD